MLDSYAMTPCPFDLQCLLASANCGFTGFEQLDGAGIELPSLYKYIESQVPDCCRTEAWRKRAHWVGTQAPAELNQSIRDAEHYLQSHQPVRRKHGRVYEIGSGGYLAKNLSVKDSDNFREYSEQDWHTFDEIIHSNQWSDINSLSNNWAAVYLASTPQQAANLGLNLPGVNEVEEIGEIEGNPLYAEAIQNEKEIGFSEEQKRNYRKVWCHFQSTQKRIGVGPEMHGASSSRYIVWHNWHVITVREEDDMKVSKKLQLRLKQKRKRKVKYQSVSFSRWEHIQNDILDGTANTGEFQSDFIDQISPCPFAGHTTNTAQDLKLENSMDEKLILHGIIKKRLLESVDADGHDSKRCRAVVIESDDEVINVVKDKVAVQDLPMHLSPSERVREVDVIDVDVLCSPTSANYCSGSNVPLTFHCTACSEVLKASEVQGHPLIEVIICGNCKLLVEDKMKTKDPDDFCRWCGKPDDLIGCNSCKMLFCAMCISRNFGETRLLEVKANGWDCCCCLPMLLEPFILEFKKAVKGFSVSSSESEFELPDGEMDVRLGHKKRRKRRIRRIMDDAELGEETKRKIAMEKARQDHLKSMQASSFSKLSTIRSSNESATEGIMTDATEGFIINVARETDEEPVRIPQSICAKLKPHQVPHLCHVNFNWIGDFGCQVIAFLYTALRKADLGLRTALVVTPVNVLHNWRREFAKWQPTELKPLRVFMLEDVARERRLDLLLKWRMKGGVFLVGYAAFRNLSLGRHAKDRNTASEISHALRMVDFVREGFLGSSQEFRNRFQNPIENGQHTNSTMNDVRTMNQRSHILYEQLKGFVQRVDMNVVKKDLPAKTVFVITVKLSPLQRKLYKKFLEVHGFTRESISSEKMIRKRCFFAGYQALAQIWNHPGLLQMAKEHKNFSRKEDAVENFLVEDSSSDDNMESVFMNGGS
ncbi:hypothetical protein ZIOFF_056325 [Zingiber officinale]|uniref:PHD-type domain-containing protein n=1 Tax=Zingiber officinale TaxID=94328 RepID=A0A8J5KKZ2_ZINOF|nr:hypothetical protein ZIOFF_056325 [Zingiber officinale]